MNKGPLYKSRYSQSRSRAHNKTRKTVKRGILPRGLSVGRRAELRANITRRALQNARRRGKTISRSNIKLPIDSIKDVNRYLRNLTTTYEDEQNSGSNSKLLDAVSQVFDRISAEIIEIRGDLPSLSGTKYPVLKTDDQDKVLERIEELTVYISKVVIKTSNNEVASKILKIMRGAFQESKRELLELMEQVESDSESENENGSDSDSEKDEEMSDDLNNLMMALGTIKF